MRAHIYWAGDDHDGTVVGYYWAVVETLVIDEFGQTPQLPGPKPRDYQYTTKTDSTFIFNVSETSPDRQHAFFIYAVDNQGKADATPARFIFDAHDNFPPIPVMRFSSYPPIAGQCECLGYTDRGGFIHRELHYCGDAVGHGTVYHWDPLLRRAVSQAITYCVDDTDAQVTSTLAPKDTVPINARLDFHWNGVPKVAGTYVAYYRYNLSPDENQPIRADSSRHDISYNTAGPVLTAGGKVFNLKVIDQAGGASRTSRKFQLNYSPETWISGPDLSNTVWQTQIKNGRTEHFYPVTNWSALPAIPGSLLGCDSIATFPAARPERRTFLELYKDTIWARSENDTVHMNSWALVYGGGSDPDSPYDLYVDPTDPSYLQAVAGCDTAGLQSGGPNGSIVGFHSAFSQERDPDRSPVNKSPTTLFPVFDQNSIDPPGGGDNARIGAYEPLTSSGKIFAILRGEDANRAKDDRIDPLQVRQFANDVDRGGGSDYQRQQRHKILTFYVNKSPYLTFTAPGFSPAPPFRTSSRTG